MPVELVQRREWSERAHTIVHHKNGPFTHCVTSDAIYLFFDLDVLILGRVHFFLHFRTSSRGFSRIFSLASHSMFTASHTTPRSMSLYLRFSRAMEPAPRPFCHHDKHCRGVCAQTLTLLLQFHQRCHPVDIAKLKNVHCRCFWARSIAYVPRSVQSHQ